MTLGCGVGCANRERGLEVAARAPSDLDRTLAAIDRQSMVATLDHLTSDDCAGRDTPQPGLVRAIEFVEREFEMAGLEPLGDTGFRHGYECFARGAAPSCSLVVRVARGEFPLTLATQFTPARYCGDAAGGGELVFAGYGIQEPEWDWDDYSGLDPKGRVVVVLAGEPRESSDGDFFGGREMTESASIREKARVARTRGAVGLIVVTVDDAEDRRWLETQLPYIHRGEPVADYALPTLVVNGRVLGAKLEVDFALWRADLDSGRVRAEECRVAGAADYVVKHERKRFAVANVAARYPGADPTLAPHAIVVGAHLDHLGVDDRGRIHRGADDNAAGVSVLISIAHALGAAKPRLQRSIVLVAFTGEEKGMLGSAAFVDSAPGLSAESMFAMINLDVISRGPEDEIEATWQGPENILTKLLPAAVQASGTGFRVGDGGEDFRDRSDQVSFRRSHIPWLYFNAGVTHEDYHRWTDTVDKVDLGKVEGVAKIVLALTLLLANEPALHLPRTMESKP